ncbi:MAG TPA: hypothetical protein VHR66_33080 [Gemmataceae bacterium]|jgi:hypothetical protein|nr:hypothetical protein [Gemmataceae bacterium]
MRLHRQRLDKLEQQLRARASQRVEDYAKYRDDPAGFARDVLGVTLTPQQVQVAELLLVPPYRVLVPSANNQGKTFLAAVITIWWFCTRKPVKVLTTAPTFDQVKKLLWSEIRRLAGASDLNLPLLPEACEMRRGPADFAMGTTARKEGGFKGKHGPNQLLIFDEATDVESMYWSAAETMFQPPGHAWLAIFNPTDRSSRAYLELSSTQRRGRKPWHVVRLSALEHPNIAAELQGLPPVIPDAMRLDSLERRIPETCQLVAGEPSATDLQWPPATATAYLAKTGQQPRWWRPGPEAEATLLGRFPSQGAYAVWSDGDWQAACREGLQPLEIPLDELPVIGCDTAHGGLDNTEFHVRCGPCSLEHDTIAGNSTPQIVGRLIELTRQWADWYNARQAERPVSSRGPIITEFNVPIVIDNAPCGFGVVDDLQAAGYQVTGVTASEVAAESDRYPNKRSELWFVTAEMARNGEIDVSRLSDEWKDELGRQAKSASYSLNGKGQRVVDSKDKLKEKLSRSPDSCDAMNLSYYGAGVYSGPGVMPTTLGRQGSMPWTVGRW